MTATNLDVAGDLESEQVVLGILLRCPEEFGNVGGVLCPDDFYRPAHATIYRTIEELGRIGLGGLLAVKNALHATGELARIGQGTASEADGIGYLADLHENAGWCASNLPYAAGCVRNASLLRRVDSFAGRMQRQARTTAVHHAQELLVAMQRELLDIDVRGATAEASATAGQAVRDALEHADAVKAGLVSPGLVTGFPLLDRATGGMQPGALWTLAGATSIGKSSFALAIARNVAAAGGAVLYASAEMDRRSLGFRLLQAQAQVSGGRLRIGNMDENERASVDAAQKMIGTWPLVIDDHAGTVGQIGLRARQAAARLGRPLALVVVDHLQLLKPTEGETRAQQVGAMAWGLKRLAMEQGCSVLLLSQLNRESVRTGAPPSVFALKESGDVENDSDVVILLHRPDPPQLDTDGALLVWVKLAKARDGQVTPWPFQENPYAPWRGIRVRFRPEFTRFEPVGGLPA
jgi:replicative DNA helicase